VPTDHDKDEVSGRARGQQVALWRYQLICPALEPGLSTKARGRVVRAIAAGSHPGPFGSAVAAQPSPLLPPDSLPAAASQDQALADDGSVGQDEQVDDYDTASDMDVGGSDDDSWA